MKRGIRWSGLAKLLVSLVLSGMGLLLVLREGATLPNIGTLVMFGSTALYFAFQAFPARRPAARAPQPQASQEAVTFTDAAIFATYANGSTLSLQWDELTEVGIATSDAGPWSEDVFWGLHAGDELRLAFGQRAEGTHALLAEMQARLPGLDDRKVIEAMGSTRDAHFVVWVRAAAEPG